MANDRGDFDMLRKIQGYDNFLPARPSIIPAVAKKRRITCGCSVDGSVVSRTKKFLVGLYLYLALVLFPLIQPRLITIL